ANVVHRLQIPSYPLTDVKIALAAGTAGTNSTRAARIEYEIGGQLESAEFVIVPDLHYDMILGMPWFVWRRPNVDYDQKKLCYRNTSGKTRSTPYGATHDNKTTFIHVISAQKAKRLLDKGQKGLLVYCNALVNVLD
ncbi:hypothetical protein HK405_014162, partial [Cladochytrium tenue]